MHEAAKWLAAGTFLFVCQTAQAADTAGANAPAHLEAPIHAEPKTLTESEFFKQLIGIWKMTGTENGKPVDYTMVGDQTGGGWRLLIRGGAGSKAFENIITISAFSEKHQHRVLWQDESRFGGGGTVQGTGERDGESFAITLDYGGSSRIEYRETFTYDEASKRWHWQSEYREPGEKWKTDADYTLEKKQ